MKKILCIFISLLILTLTLCCCDLSNVDSENTSSQNTTSAISKEKPDIDYDKSLEPIFEFLSSEYILISTRKTFDTYYVTYYYFVDGIVAGVKSVIAFPDTDSATAYYNSLKKDHKYSRLDGMTVINYIEDDEDYYYGYTLDKLIFVLEKADYEVIVGFDKNEFYKDFSGVEYD